MAIGKILTLGYLFLISKLLANDLGYDKCDKLGILIYEDIGCKPVIIDGLDCPLKYDCDLTIKNNTCLIRNRYIPVGEHIPKDITFGTCDFACICGTSRSISEYSEPELKSLPTAFHCAIIDCVESFDIPLEENCHRKYDLGSCCSTGEICIKNDCKPDICEVNGEKILEGQLFFPKNTCSRCVCTRDYDGKLQRSNCMRRKCGSQIRNQNEIVNKCAPVYLNVDDDVLCCPSRWLCPTPKDKIIKISTKPEKFSNLTCQFGTRSVKLGYGLDTSMKWFDERVRPIRCECDLPPFLTCKEIKV